MTSVNIENDPSKSLRRVAMWGVTATLSTAAALLLVTGLSWTAGTASAAASPAAAHSAASAGHVVAQVEGSDWPWIVQPGPHATLALSVDQPGSDWPWGH
ncbi:hypothetical protein [Amycolatopsis sp. H20-H5]|uniref:hypothetical protein n=1 Tax=Amycolatopsis sp. H20-H5 TaxID=3046309 RepID=UPI002DBA2A36|nr:hypothetical protein [Amycolatopsis sp. H20-H5]MEC3976393.1 hypothetical protein [Amycolatopsis sp. H20-H5]